MSALGGGRLQAALECLEGLAIGDALGEEFFGRFAEVALRISERLLPPAEWHFTDDTMMAASVVEVLAHHHGVEQDALAESFARHYETGRGYGAGAGDLLRELRSRGAGAWRELAPAMFGGSGSFGNGAAMRVAPLGAYYAGDSEMAAAEARKQAHVTHSHPEGADGAAAVAAAAARNAVGTAPTFEELLEVAIRHAGKGSTAAGLALALRLGPGASTRSAAEQLGTGQEVAAFDTVPFALWSAAVSPDDFEAVFWRTVAGLGDRDTTCAIASGLVAARVGRAGLPEEWLARREPLPDWVLQACQE
jgi:ADP-ribosylglycohydrolase